MGFRDIDGKSTISHRFGAIISPTNVSGSGPWTVTGNIRDETTLDRSPGLEVAVGDIVTSLYVRGSQRMIASYQVTQVIAASAGSVTLVVASIDDPLTVSFPVSTCSITRPAGNDELSLVDGEPNTILLAKLNNVIERVGLGLGAVSPTRRFQFFPPGNSLSISITTAPATLPADNNLINVYVEGNRLFPDQPGAQLGWSRNAISAPTVFNLHSRNDEWVMIEWYED